MSDRFADCGAYRLRYQVEGPEDGPPMLLMHALGASLDLWDPQVAALAGRYRIIRFDTRGHGRSGAPTGEYTIADLGGDAVAVLDAAGVEKATVGGISLGGLTAMWMGVHAGPRVRALLLANTAARVGTASRWTERVALVRGAGMSAVADLAMGTWFTETYRQREPAVVQRFHRMVASTSPEAYAGCCAALRDADLRPGLGRITAPTLVIAGTQDASTPLTEAQGVADGITGASLRVLDCAHLSNVECADGFTRHLEEFLAS